MPRIVADSPEAASVDETLAVWRQGDVALGEILFVHTVAPRRTLTDGIDQDDDVDLATVETPVVGVVIVTQTCDLVRACVERPFVEVSPLVEVGSDALLDEVRKGLRPRYLFVPAMAKRRLVGDLDRTMTVEKPVVAAWTRTPGCDTDSERHALAQALARKRARMAFPDDFNTHVARLAKRIKDKHGKQSDEGRLLAAIREIRVTASPQWDAASVTLMLWFVLDDDQEDASPMPDPKKTELQVAEWLKLVPAGGRFLAAQGMAVSLTGMTAADYVHSDRLDLDHLSG